MAGDSLDPRVPNQPGQYSETPSPQNNKLPKKNSNSPATDSKEMEIDKLSDKEFQMIFKEMQWDTSENRQFSDFTKTIHDMNENSARRDHTKEPIRNLGA